METKDKEWELKNTIKLLKSYLVTYRDGCNRKDKKIKELENELRKRRIRADNYDVLELRKELDETLKVLRHVRRKYKPYKRRYEQLKQKLNGGKK